MRSGEIVSFTLCLCVLLSSACGRLGFEVVGEAAPVPPRDAGRDAGGAEAGMPFDAATSMDAALMDAAVVDASGVDAARVDDAGDDDAGSADAGPICAVASGASYCSELPRLPGMPQIDGVLEGCLTLEPIVPVSWTSATPLPAASSSRFAAAWLPGGLYVYIDVDDTSRLPAISPDATWCGDGIEVYVDDDGLYAAAPMYDSPGTAQLMVAAPESDVINGTRSERYRDGMLQLTGATAGNFVTFPRLGGYVLEGFITAPDLDLGTWTLQAGALVGLDISINVSASADPPPVGETVGCGRRMGQYFLKIGAPPCTGSGCLPFFSVDAFCSPQLK